MCEMYANVSEICNVVKCYANIYSIPEHDCFTFTIKRSRGLIHYQCTLSENSSLSYEAQNLSYCGVFVFNTLILLLSGIINILLCKRLRGQSELHAEVSDPSPPDTPETDFSPSLNQANLNPNYTTLQFPENNARRKSSETETRVTRRDIIYSSLKCHKSVSDITE